MFYLMHGPCKFRITRRASRLTTIYANCRICDWFMFGYYRPIHLGFLVKFITTILLQSPRMLGTQLANRCVIAPKVCTRSRAWLVNLSGTTLLYLCQRGGWLRRANGGERAPGTGAALRPVLTGIRAMNGTLSAKRYVKLAPCSAAEARQVGGRSMTQPRLLGRRLDEHRGETPPHIACLRIAAAISWAV
jgi:hypothetical protein